MSPRRWKIAVPTERREHERRVALTPDAVTRLTGQGIEVLVHAGAGAAASLPGLGSDAAAPAPAWTSARCPWPVSRVTASGVRATRRSCRKTVGTAILDRRAAAAARSERGRQKRP